jgi:hypothetical protein
MLTRKPGMGGVSPPIPGFLVGKRCHIVLCPAIVMGPTHHASYILDMTSIKASRLGRSID